MNEKMSQKKRENIATLAMVLFAISVLLFVIDGVRSCSRTIGEVNHGMKYYHSR